MKSKEQLSKIIIWAIILIYTLLLPHAIIVYRNLVNRIGEEAVGTIPIISVAIIGSAYVSFGFAKNRNLRHTLYLIPSGIIALAIIQLEPNPNKHIHIPEYVLMAWLLYFVMSKDYRGNGLLGLIFVCGSMLGVVDELEQGIHPRRFYGWSDMAVNSSSVIIGIFTILGLAKIPGKSWDWLQSLPHFRKFAWLVAFGFINVAIACVQLFEVQKAGTFTGVYPLWLLGGNILFLAIGLQSVSIRIRDALRAKRNSHLDNGSNLPTAKLWIFTPLAILLYAQTLIILVSLTGLEFR